MTRVFVTGGAGFIGSHICDRIIKKGFHVVCFDNLITGFIENIEHLIGENSFTFIKGDIRDLEAVRAGIDGCTHVCHQAALGSVTRSIKDPLNTNKSNIEGFLNMIYASKESKVKRFLYAASSSTYGDHKALPKKENIIGNPLSPYAVTKRVNEMYADVFNKVYGINSVGLRYFNVL